MRTSAQASAAHPQVHKAVFGCLSGYVPKSMPSHWLVDNFAISQFHPFKRPRPPVPQQQAGPSSHPEAILKPS